LTYLKEIFDDQIEATLSSDRVGDLDLEFIDNTLDWLQVNLENLVQEDVDGSSHKLALQEHKDLLFLDKGNTPLEFNDLPSAFTFIVQDGNLIPTLLTEKLFNEFKAQKKPLLVAHKTSEADSSYNSFPVFGVLPAEIFNLLPKGFDQGYLDPNTGENYQNIYLSNPDYIRLENRIKVEDGNIIIRPEGWYSDFIEIDSNSRTSHYYSAFSVSTSLISGTYCFCTLQEIEGTFDPIPVLPKFLPEISRKSLRKFRNEIWINPINSEHRSIIPTEVFFETYLNIIDLRYILKTADIASAKRSYSNSYINDKIGYFNIRFDPYSGRLDLSTYRDKNDVEGIMNKIFENEQEIRQFLFLKEEDGIVVPMHKSDFTLKQWMHWLYERITNIDLELQDDRVSSLIGEAQTKIFSKYKQNPFDVSEGRQEKSSKEELFAAKFLYDIYSRLFGHMTLRFLFMHLIDFYGGPAIFKLDFLNVPSHIAITMFLKQFTIITSTQPQSTPIYDENHVQNHLFSLFFLNSYIQLPIDEDIDIDSDDNKIYFGYSPLTFVDSSFSASMEKILNMKIKDCFMSKYKIYKLLHYSYSGLDRRINLFTKSGYEMLDVVRNELREVVDMLELSSEEREEIYNRLIVTAEKEILDYTHWTIKYNKIAFYNIRFQVENLLIGWDGIDFGDFRYNREDNQFQDRLVFHQVILDRDIYYKNSDKIAFHKDESFSISINKDLFAGKDIKIWRVNKYQQSVIRNSDFDANQYNRGIVLEKAQILLNAITDVVGQNGKVRIYPLHHRSSSEGYHFLLRYKFSTLIPSERSIIPNDPYNTKDARRFDIDLQDPNVQEKLQHIVKLSMSYIDPSSSYPFAKDFLFIITKDDIGVPIYWYDKIIGAFDAHRFYKPNEILSMGEKNYDFAPVFITDYEEGMQIKLKFIKQWNNLKDFLRRSTSVIFPNNYIPWWNEE